MSMLSATFILYHNLKTGFELGRAGTTAPANVACAVTALPARLPYQVSLELALRLYLDQAANTAAPVQAASAAVLYGVPVGSPETPTALGTFAAVNIGTELAPVYELAGRVQPGTIPQRWATWPRVRLYFDIVSADTAPDGDRYVVWQDVAIIDLASTGAEVAYPTSGQVATTLVTLSTSAALAYAPGLQVVILDTAAGAVTATLWDVTAHDADWAVVVVQGGSHVGSLALHAGQTINGQAGPVALHGIGDHLRVFPVPGAAAAVALNPVTTVP